VKTLTVLGKQAQSNVDIEISILEAAAAGYQGRFTDYLKRISMTKDFILKWRDERAFLSGECEG
jgi:hypothetical protein